MTPCAQFITAVHHELDGLCGDQPTRLIRRYRGWGVTFDAALQRRRPRGSVGRIAIHSPPSPNAGNGIAIEPFGGQTQSVIYATGDDLPDLPRTVARLFAQPPDAGGVVVWCTAAARQHCWNAEMGRPGTRLLEDLSLANASL